MHYDRETIFAATALHKGMTVEELREIHCGATLDLKEGDTAYTPGTTKYYIAGPGSVAYVFYPKGSGDDCRIVEGTHKTYTKSE